MLRCDCNGFAGLRWEGDTRAPCDERGSSAGAGRASVGRFEMNLAARRPRSHGHLEADLGAEDWTAQAARYEARHVKKSFGGALALARPRGAGTIKCGRIGGQPLRPGMFRLWNQFYFEGFHGGEARRFAGQTCLYRPDRAAVDEGRGIPHCEFFRGRPF